MVDLVRIAYGFGHSASPSGSMSERRRPLPRATPRPADSRPGVHKFRGAPLLALFMEGCPTIQELLVNTLPRPGPCPSCVESTGAGVRFGFP